MNNVTLRPGDVATVKRKPPTFSPTTGTRESSKRPTKGRVIAVTPWFATLLFDSGVKESFSLDEILEVNPGGAQEPVLGKKPRPERLEREVGMPKRVSEQQIRDMQELRDKGSTIAEIERAVGVSVPTVKKYVGARLSSRNGKPEQRDTGGDALEAQIQQLAQEVRTLRRQFVRHQHLPSGGVALPLGEGDGE